MYVIWINSAPVAYRYRPGPGRTIVFANSLKLTEQTVTEIEKGTDE